MSYYDELDPDVSKRKPLKKWEFWHEQSYTLEALKTACTKYGISYTGGSTKRELVSALNKAKVPRIPPENLSGRFGSTTESKDADLVEKWAPDPKTEPIADPLSFGIDFSKIVRYAHLAGGLGSAGVFALLLSDSGLLVCKESKAVYSDFVANALGRKLGISGDDAYGKPKTVHWIVPAFRALYNGQPEFMDIACTLERLEPLRNKGTGAEVPKIRRLALTNHMLLMKYVVGTSIWNLPEEHAEVAKVLNPAVLKTFGRTVFFDMLINNWDRIPMKGVWSNEGNGSNVMFSYISGETDPSENKLILIDQTVSLIKLFDQRVKYMDDLRRFAKEAFLQRSKETSKTVMRSLQEFIIASTAVNHDIGIEGERFALDGFCDTISELLLSDEAFDSFKKTLDGIKYDTSTKIPTPMGVDSAISEGVDDCLKFILDAASHLRTGAREALSETV